MYSVPTTPKTIGGVLDDIFKLFPGAVAASWPIAVMASVAITVPSLVMFSQGTLGPNPTPAEMLALFTSSTFVSVSLVSWILYFIFNTAMLVRVQSVASQQDSSIAEAMGKGLRLSPRVLLASILYGLAMLLGFVLLVIPMFFVMIAFMFYSVCIVTEGASAFGSLSRSRRLTKGSWWRTLAIFSVAMIVAYLLLGCVQFGAGLLVGFGGDSALLQLTNAIVSAVMYIVILPFTCATMLVIYFDLKLRSEGDDLSQRVDSLAKA